MKLLTVLALVVGLGIYPSAGTVTDVNRETDIVEWIDGAGECWEIEGCEDWEIGDGIAVIMWNSNTPDDIHDDVIVDYRYTR